MSDAELQEGQNWEALMCAAKYRLGNLTVLIDRNSIQIGGDTEEIMPIEPLADKLKCFGWHTVEINGHDLPQIIHTCQAAQATKYPTAVICRTIPGKGVSFIENNHEWHGKPPSPEEAEAALQELEVSHE
jgi:transketolase